MLWIYWCGDGEEVFSLLFFSLWNSIELCFSLFIFCVRRRVMCKKMRKFDDHENRTHTHELADFEVKNYLSNPTIVFRICATRWIAAVHLMHCMRACARAHMYPQLSLEMWHIVNAETRVELASLKIRFKFFFTLHKSIIARFQCSKSSRKILFFMGILKRVRKILFRLSIISQEGKWKRILKPIRC